LSRGQTSLRRRLPLIAAISFTVLSGGSAAWMTLHRHSGYAVRCVRAEDVYHLADQPRILDYRVNEHGMLQLDLLNVEEQNWVVTTDSQTTRSATGAAFSLPEGIGFSTLYGETSGLEIRIRSQWDPEAAAPLISSSGLPVGPPSPYSTSDFVLFPDAQDELDIEAARALLAPLALDEATNDLRRMEILASFLHRKLLPHRGTPEPRMRRLNGYRQFLEATKGRSEVYCANHSEIYAFMANSIGLPTRVVDIGGRLGDAALGAHSFGETWVRELQRWVYVDLQLGLASVRDPLGEPLSAANLLSRIRTSETSMLSTRSLSPTGVLDRPFLTNARLIETFLSPSAALVFLPADPARFSLISRLHRLLLAPPPAICGGGLPDRSAWRLTATWIAFIATLCTATLATRSFRSPDPTSEVP